MASLNARDRTRTAALGTLALGVLALAAATGLGQPPRPGPTQTRPNLILVSLDTLRADRLGCYGHDRATSPFLDELAAAGVVFDDASAPSSKTAPSHMSMFTGVHPSVHGVRNYYGREAWAPNADLVTLPERASEAGYITAGFTGGGMLSAELGFERGFDVYDAKGGGADRVFGRAEAWIREASQELMEDEPVFFFLHTYEIHDPYTPPLQWQQRFVDPGYDGGVDATRIEYPENASEVWKTDPSFYQDVQQRFWGGFDGRRPGEFEHLRNLYDAGIAFTDDLLRGVFDELRAAGWLDNAWVIVTSDHGEEFGERGGVSHQTIYDEILHVPLIVVPPAGRSDARRGERVDAPVMGADLAPTVIDLLGLEPLAVSQAASWAPYLVGDGGPSGRAVTWRPIWAELATPSNDWLALRRGPYKLFQHRLDPDQRALFDRWVDPGETIDLLPTQPELAARLRQELHALHQQNAAGAEQFPAGEAAIGDAALGALYALGYATQEDDTTATEDGDVEEEQ